MWVEDWAARAACKGDTPDALFVRGAEQNKAKQVCAGCPVRTECLAEALDNQIEWGVWGGMTERERRALLRKRPNVTSWRVLLETARTPTDGRIVHGAKPNTSPVRRTGYTMRYFPSSVKMQPIEANEGWKIWLARGRDLAGNTYANA